jgi:predicted nucleotidyltransferase component of viral defense system
MNEIITERLLEYKVKSAEEELNAIKEITQEVILYALSKTSFFDHAHFLGGTALRIVHGLNRFSEDLDFSTYKVDKNFQFDDYMDEVLLSLQQYGLEMIVKKAKDDSFVKARGLKEDSDKWTLSFPTNKQLKKVIIKLEIDTNPPSGALIENANLDFPILHQVKVGTMETLFAGKIHALLCRKFMKGRDWYDFLWYVRNKTNINYDLLKNALFQMGPYQGQELKVVNRDFLVKELREKVKSLDWKEVRKDVERFLKPDELESLKIWDENLFLERVDKIFNN